MLAARVTPAEDAAWREKVAAGVSPSALDWEVTGAPSRPTAMKTVKG